MRPALLDFSRRGELALHAAVVADVETAAAPLGISSLIAGAFARDLHLHHGHGIATVRQTQDIDFAISVPDWGAFEALRNRMIASGAFSDSTPAAVHRLLHRGGLPVDLVPFGLVETRERTIAWPPGGEVVMDVFGYREALFTSQVVSLPGGTRTRVVSLPALALLKLVCWQDRHYIAPRKDAHDLNLILRHYLPAGNEERLYTEFVALTHEDGFDYEVAGTRMLGHDVGLLLDDRSRARVRVLLAEQASEAVPALLPEEMSAADPDRARKLLGAMLEGLIASRSP